MSSTSGVDIKLDMQKRELPEKELKATDELTQEERFSKARPSLK